MKWMYLSEIAEIIGISRTQLLREVEVLRQEFDFELPRKKKKIQPKIVRLIISELV